MFCPTCGQQQVAENVRFCSRCGFLLTGVSEVIAHNGLVPTQSNQTTGELKDSPRKRGVKQGAMLLLVGMLLIVPLLAMIHIVTDTEPYIMAVAAIISFWGGVLRMIYAWMFEESVNKQFSTGTGQQFVNQQFIAGNQAQNALPPSQSIPVTDYIAPKPGSWHTTNNLVQPASITEGTTKFLEKETNAENS